VSGYSFGSRVVQEIQLHAPESRAVGTQLAWGLQASSFKLHLSQRVNHFQIHRKQAAMEITKILKHSAGFFRKFGYCTISFNSAQIIIIMAELRRRAPW
jgi:hypothetical protein